jgi:hypothetical protein
MKTVIYYYSATGNSLAVAKSLAKELDGTVELKPMVGCHLKEREVVQAERVGFVFPVKNLSVPEVVQSFIKQLECRGECYVFSVATCNAVPGHTLFTMKSLLKRKNLTMNAGFVVDMPGNILMNPEDVQNERLGRSRKKISEMVEAIQKGQSGIVEGSNALKWHIQGGFLQNMTELLMPANKRFRAKKNCPDVAFARRYVPCKILQWTQKPVPSGEKHASSAWLVFTGAPLKLS